MLSNILKCYLEHHIDNKKYLYVKNYCIKSLIPSLLKSKIKEGGFSWMKHADECLVTKLIQSIAIISSLLLPMLIILKKNESKQRLLLNQRYCVCY